MKIVFVSNRLTWHQLPFSEQMDARRDTSYTFVATSDICPDQRHKYPECEKYSFFKYINPDSISKKEYEELFVDSDVLIIGSAPDILISERLKRQKLTFKYSERLYKTGFPAFKYLKNAASAWLHHGRFQKFPLYMLCSSAYTAADCTRFGNYKNRCYKWGYFPEIKRYDNIENVIANKTPHSILWVGRMLDWKHPETAIQIAERLKKGGYAFNLNIIGGGELEGELTRSIKASELQDCVQLLGAISPEEVRENMEATSVFLFTSDFNEGWGAVLNEAMNSGCAVVASHAVGSAPFLIKNGENGYLYKSGDVNDLYKKVRHLLDNKPLADRFGLDAYKTITGLWSAELAADRIVKLSSAILSGDKSPDLFENGPCSRADTLKNDWWK